jgi:hypothetical protein
MDVRQNLLSSPPSTAISNASHYDQGDRHCKLSPLQGTYLAFFCRCKPLSHALCHLIYTSRALRAQCLGCTIYCRRNCSGAVMQVPPFPREKLGSSESAKCYERSATHELTLNSDPIYASYPHWRSPAGQRTLKHRADFGTTGATC